MSFVLAEKQLNSLILTLNRPEKFNSLTLEMVKTLRSNFSKPGIKIINSNHPKAFCAGGDVVTLLSHEKEGADFFREEYKTNLALYQRNREKDTVAIVNGICLGGGVGISAHAPFVVVTENVKYGMPETKIGLHPDVGGSFFLPRLKVGTGLLLGLTGKMITSPWLLREIGYANYFVPSQRIPHLIKELGNIDQVDALPDVLQEFAEVPEPQLGDDKILDIANDCFLNNSLDEIFETLEERKDCKLCVELLGNLNAGSPLSLILTHRLYNLKAQTLEEALRNEFRVSTRLLAKGSDFHIGVTHALINKSKEPVKWNYSSIDDVPEKVVEEYLKPLQNDWHP